MSDVEKQQHLNLTRVHFYFESHAHHEARTPELYVRKIITKQKQTKTAF